MRSELYQTSLVVKVEVKPYIGASPGKWNTNAGTDDSTKPVVDWVSLISICWCKPSGVYTQKGFIPGNIKAYLWKTWYKFWSPFMHIGADQRSESQVEAEDKALHHHAMKEAWSVDAHG